MNNKQKYYINNIIENLLNSENKYIPWSSTFVDSLSRSLIEKELSKINFSQVQVFFYGGYEDADRNIVVALPDYADLKTEKPLSIVRVVLKKGSRPLKHGDYLGSLLGLGLSRDKIGDILVRDDGADIVATSDIVDFLLSNYTKAKRENLSVEKVDIEEGIFPKADVVITTDTVASLRLDNLVSSAFGLARTKATQAIEAGLVFVDNIEKLNKDYQVRAGQKVNLRGKGKIKLLEIGGKSRKDRIYITYEKYR